MGRTKRAEGDPILVKKYANRRLYNTATSSYVTLDDLSELVRSGEDIKVVDAKSGDDLTHSVLAQIILEKESQSEQMLPPSFLRQLISMYGNGLEKFVPSYLSGALENLSKNQENIRQAFMSGSPTAMIEEMTRQNMAIAQNAMRLFTGGMSNFVGGSGDRSEIAQKEAEIERLKAELEALQRKADQSKS